MLLYIQKSHSARRHNIKKETHLMLTNCMTHLQSVKVTKHDTIRYVRYGFLLVCYSNFVPKTHRF